MNGHDSLKALRERRGWSWTDLAKALRERALAIGLTHFRSTTTASIRRNVARWEHPQGTTPDGRHQLLLCHVYARGADGVIATHAGSDLSALFDALSELGIDSDRIAFLHQAIGNISAPLATPDLDQLRLKLESIAETVGVVPFARSQYEISSVIDGLDALQVSATDESYRRLVAPAFALAGRISFELHDDDAMAGYYARAIRHAERQPDTWVTATTLSSVAIIAMHRQGDLSTADRLSRDAERWARRSDSTATIARTLAVQAEISARRGHVRPALNTLDIAASMMADASAADLASERMSRARLDGFIGLCDMLTGRGLRAVASLDKAVQTMDGARNSVQRSIVQADLAIALATCKSPDPQRASAELGRVIGVVAAHRGRVGIQRVRLARNALQPWSSESFVREVDERLWSLLT